jgi:hypothetical protein
MALNRLRARCEAQVRALELPARVDLDSVVAAVAARRRHPIALCPVRGRPVPCGMWVAADSRDYVFYEADTSPLHRAHIILHELAHALLGHDPARIARAELLRELLPDLDAHLLEHVLERASYARPDEQEAELLASLLLSRLSLGPPTAPPDDPAIQSARERLERSLEVPTLPAP